jgi:hypothetical protein
LLASSVSVKGDERSHDLFPRLAEGWARRGSWLETSAEGDDGGGNDQSPYVVTDLEDTGGMSPLSAHASPQASPRTGLVRAEELRFHRGFEVTAEIFSEEVVVWLGPSVAG